MAQTHESASVYQGDEINYTFIESGYLVVVCKYSVFRIDLATREVTRIL